MREEDKNLAAVIHKHFQTVIRLYVMHVPVCVSFRCLQLPVDATCCMCALHLNS